MSSAQTQMSVLLHGIDARCDAVACNEKRVENVKKKNDYKKANLCKIISLFVHRAHTKHASFCTQ